MDNRISTIGDLIHDRSNPRKHNPRNIKVIVDSLHDVGFARSIVIDEDNNILAGNGVTEAAMLAGIEKVIEVEADGNTIIAVRRRGLTDEQKQRLKYFDNLSGELADWDTEQLLADMQAGLDLSGMFREDELDALLAELQPEPVTDAGAQVDKADELRQKWGVELGQMWQLGEHRLICGDCTDAAVVARVMGGERASLAWFDPPFGIDLIPQRGLTKRIQGDGNADAQALWAAFLPLLYSNLTETAHVFLCQGWTEFDWTLPLIREWFTLKSKVVWNKNVWGIGYYTRPKHEDIIYCWKGEPKPIAAPVADVWDVARESAPDHAAEKPPQLSANAIDHFSHKADVVVDWFSGVGGSTIACEGLGRRCRSIEIDAGFVAITLQRFADSTNKTPVLVD